MVKRPPSHNLSLRCFTLGNTFPDDIFEINITKTKNVSALKDAIKDNKPNTLREIDLALYKIRLPTGNSRPHTLESLGLKNEEALQDGSQLADTFSNLPTEYLVIVQPLPAMWKDRNIAPAKSHEYINFQRGEERMLDGRYAFDTPTNTVAPPIQLFNSAFAYFSSKAFDPEYNVPPYFLRKVQALAAGCAAIYENEDDRQEALRPLLRGVMGYSIATVQHGSGDSTIEDDVLQSNIANSTLSLYSLFSVSKNEIGDGGLDPSVQASFSFRRVLLDKELLISISRCCAPAFLLAHAGPSLAILGGVITSGCIVQPLTDFIHLPTRSTHDNDHFFRFARILYALKESLVRLNAWYQGVANIKPFDPSAPNGRLHPRFFPSPDTFKQDDALVKFDYLRPLDGDVSCVAYLAKTVEADPVDVVVKFVDNYGDAAHELMANAGFAPKLLYCGKIDVNPDMPSYGTLKMVVMEYNDGLTMHSALQYGKPRPRCQLEDLEKAIQMLHDEGFVFGDLRPPNVMVEDGGRVQLIDFDWAGKEGEVKYPRTMSTSIDWPKGAQAWEPIQKQHDIEMLKKLTARWNA
ncbi:hypothetical protein BJ138DRAFT_1096518 [Hygrophoropsis aurantiaca]|uniref:Uncharacterized protein n=1 Tax=Hygrophoropsis aurantiaca TaxID=72124 RepID=A0ACB7ZRM3_9AGAM|nr:hypothetical protein BJ138DRAFT_1096518 [Hygrophoropsis aurantiaca]